MRKFKGAMESIRALGTAYLIRVPIETARALAKQFDVYEYCAPLLDIP
jgi:hypothetical protein